MVHFAATLLVALTAQQCTPRAIGPGTHVQGGTRGAACVLAAYRQGCRRADYSLTGVGVGTIAVKSFSVQPWNGGCPLLLLSTPTPRRVRGNAGGVGPPGLPRVPGVPP